MQNTSVRPVETNLKVLGIESIVVMLVAGKHDILLTYNAIKVD